MKNNLQFVAAIFLFAVLALSGCKGDKGEVGPAGATGAQGTAGPNASSFQFSFNSSNATLNATNTLAIYEYLTPLITNDIATNGTVLCYIVNGSAYSAMPLIASGNQFSFAYGAGEIAITISKLDGSAFTINPGIYTIKVILIKGSAAARTQSNGLDYSDYEAVKSFYHLAD